MLNISAQENNLDTIPSTDEENQIVEKMPEFPGGTDGFLKYLVSIKYPEEARVKGIEGSVYVRFVIDSSGKVTNAEVARGTNVILDSAAVEHVRNMPDWSPGEQKGKRVKVQYVVPIRFNLTGGSNEMPNITVKISDSKFPDGDEAIIKYLTRVKYPVEAIKKKIEGTVFVKFAVDSTGKVVNPEIVKGAHEIINNAAIEHVKKMPKSILTIQKNKEVIVEYTVSIHFGLGNDVDDYNSIKNSRVIVQNPKFPGGDEALVKYLAAVKYPEEAIEKKIEGTVHVKFTIDQNGKVKNPEVVKKVNPLLDKAALEHIANMPDWTAGTRDGIAYSSSSTIEIVFKTKTKTLNSDYYYNEGVALFQKGIIEEALVNFDKAYQLNNKDLDALFNAGICKYKLGKVNQACESWKKIQQTGSQIADIQISKYCVENN